MIYKKFYSELGKLLYAIADIDHVITSQEKVRLQNIVKEELLPSDQQTDKYGTRLPYYTEIEFDFLDEQIWDSQTAFESFIDFVEDHHTAFDPNLKRVCLQLTKELANAYKGTNRKEKDLINNLKEKLNKIEFVNP